ncbi:MAG: pilus assembly protein PilM [Bdellovibrionaceae bacterium]|jgi:general secretion pathway protein L|nr:pilus assembly protein PilM [Pseudobdellovibrionaceae bacterium]
MKSIGIDIGSYSIKIAECLSQGQGGKLVHYEELKLSQDPNHDRAIEIIDLLKTYLRKFQQEPAHFIFSVNQSSVVHRKLTFPFKERYNILKTIAFELEDDIPFSYDNAIFEAKVTKYMGNTTEVIATVCPAYQVEKTLESIKDFSIEPHILSVEGLALTNLFEDWAGLPPESTLEDEDTPEKQDARAYLHFGHNKCILLAYSKNTLVDVSHIPWGTEKIAKKLSEKYNIPFSESVKELQNKGFVLIDNSGSTTDQVTFSQLIKEPLTELSHHLKLTLMEIASHQNLDFKNIYLMGGASQIKNVGPFLTQQLDIASNPIPFPNVGIELGVSNFNSVTGQVALGLAIEGLKKPRNPATNLLKDRFAVQSNKFTAFWDSWAPLVKTATAAFVILLIFGITRESFTLNMADQSNLVLKKQANKIAGLNKRKANKANVKKYVKQQDKKAKQKMLFKDLEKVNSALDILKKVSQLSPNKKSLPLEIKIIDIQGEMVKLEGLHSKTKSIVDFQKSLKSLAISKKVTKLSPSIPSNNSMRSFAFSFKVKRK